MQHQCVVASALGEETLDDPSDRMHRFISQHFHVEIPHLWIAENLREGEGVLRR